MKTASQIVWQTGCNIESAVGYRRLTHFLLNSLNQVGIIVWSEYSLSTTVVDLLDRLAVAFNTGIPLLQKCSYDIVQQKYSRNVQVLYCFTVQPVARWLCVKSKVEPDSRLSQPNDSMQHFCLPLVLFSVTDKTKEWIRKQRGSNWQPNSC